MVVVGSGGPHVATISRRDPWRRLPFARVRGARTHRLPAELVGGIEGAGPAQGFLQIQRRVGGHFGSLAIFSSAIPTGR
jgi:hypothetical protein